MKHRNLMILGVVTILSSCGVMRDQYDIVLRNEGSVELDKAYVSYGSFRSVGGVLPPGVSATHSFVGEEESIPDEAKVEWVRTDTGERRERLLKVKSRLPTGQFVGKIVFLIDKDDVRLEWDKE